MTPLTESQKLEKLSIYEEKGYSSELIESLLKVSQENIAEAEERVDVFGHVTGRFLVEALVDEETGNCERMTFEDYHKWSTEFFKQCKEEAKNEGYN